MSAAQTFKALGDPVRLEIIDRLCNETSLTIGDVSKGLGLTRQGARKHLQVLTDAQIITVKPSGRKTSVTLNPTPLQEANSYIVDIEHKWDQRLKALRNYLES